MTTKLILVLTDRFGFPTDEPSGGVISGWASSSAGAPPHRPRPGLPPLARRPPPSPTPPPRLTPPPTHGWEERIAPSGRWSHLISETYKICRTYAPRTKKSTSTMSRTARWRRKDFSLSEELTGWGIRTIPGLLVLWKPETVITCCPQYCRGNIVNLCN